MADFLLELRCEEIPARMQAGARAELERLFRRELDAAGVAVSDLTIFSTPRRLALIARGLPLATEAVSEEAKGPPVGAPDAALDGFCRKNGVTRDQLEERDVKGRATWFAVIEKPGQSVSDLIAAAIPAIIRDFSWPKSMRWGAASISSESPKWVRPLSGIVALLDGALVPCVMDGLASGRETLGHRFHSSGPIAIDGADDYADKLRAAHVIVDHEERARLIREGAAKVAADAGLTLVADEGLVTENAGLTEWPVPLLGRFDAAFLDVPPEVIQLTARVNQKYFVCEDSAGKLANAFICTANIDAIDPAVVVDGNRKVLAARLSDARFFWELDQKTPLEDHAKKLERITFHEKLGTVADKVERVAKLARWLVEEGIVADTTVRPELVEGRNGGGVRTSTSSARTASELADLAEAAARLCKADLVTEMVGEFPELQGLMGGYYAAKEGLPLEVAEAIRDHYKPVGQGDEVPTAPVTVAVSLADKLDTLFAFFAWGMFPTGSKDPFALRRAALGVVTVLSKNELRLSLRDAGAFNAWGTIYNRVLTDHRYGEEFLLKWFTDEQREDENFSLWLEKTEDGLWNHSRLEARDVAATVFDFFADRLKVQQREAGVRHDLIDAVFALGGEDDLVRLLARVHALQAFVTTEDGANLLAGYKRAANILKKEGHEPTAVRLELSRETEGAGVSTSLDANGFAPMSLSYTPENAEKALIDALAAAAPTAAQAVSEERFEDAMAALATLRAAVDAFFDEVTVNDPDPAKRQSRLDLLARFTSAVGEVADFSRIEG